MPDQRQQARAMLPSALDRARSTATGSAPVQQPDLQSRAFTRFFDMLGGNDPEKRQRAASMADALSGTYGQFVVDMTPILGDAKAFMEARQAYDRGDMNTAAMLGGAAMLGMVPVVGDAAALAGKGGIRRIYHGTSPDSARAIQSQGFDIGKSADGTVWFTDNPNIGEVAATGKGAVIVRDIDESKLKLGGWAETDKYSTDELINMGFDGLKLEDEDGIVYQIFNPEKLTAAM